MITYRNLVGFQCKRRTAYSTHIGRNRRHTQQYRYRLKAIGAQRDATISGVALVIGGGTTFLDSWVSCPASHDRGLAGPALRPKDDGAAATCAVATILATLVPRCRSGGGWLTSVSPRGGLKLRSMDKDAITAL